MRGAKGRAWPTPESAMSAVDRHCPSGDVRPHVLCLRRLALLHLLLLGALTVCVLPGCAAPIGGDAAAQSTVVWPADRLFPRLAPVHTLWTLDVPPGTDSATLTALATLQGLVNSPQPRLYTIANADDAFWLRHAVPDVRVRRLIVGAGACAPAMQFQVPRSTFQLSASGIPRPDGRSQSHHVVLGNTRGTAKSAQEESAGLLCAVLNRFPHAAHGLVIADSSVPGAVDVGTTLAGVDRAMVITPAMAPIFTSAPFHLPILADLTALHWQSAVQAYRWAFTHLWRKAQHRLLFSLSPSIALNLREYAVATKGFVFWLDARDRVGRHLLQRILASSPRNSAVLGWWPDEQSGVALASSRAHATIASDFCDNLSVFGAFPQGSAPGPAPMPPLPPLHHEVYYSVEFSDGDNLQFMQHRMLTLWNDPARGALPATYTVQPWALQAMPTILQYYQRTAGTTNLFAAGPSGPGYFNPSDWPANDLPTWLRLGKPVLAAAHLDMIEVWGYSWELGADLAAYDRVLHPHALLLGSDGSGVLFNWNGDVRISNVGVARTVDDAVHILQSFAGPQARLAGALHTPVFVNLYVSSWSFTPTMLGQLEARLGPAYHLVRLDQLLDLWARA